jgi:TonB family protein
LIAAEGSPLWAGIGIALEGIGNFPFAQENLVLLATKQQWVTNAVLGILLATAGAALLSPSPAWGQEQAKTEEISRKAKVRVLPVYPDVARRMNIAGTVRLAVVVAPNGTVKSSKPVGGHPLLVDAAMDAMKHWKFETGPTESSGIVEFKFQPGK